MKKIIIFSLVLITVFSLSAASSIGRVGIQFDARGYIETDENPANAQEASLSITGANFFGKSRMFGVGYSIGYGFPFNSLSYFKPIHFDVDAIFSFNVAKNLSIEPRIGIADTLYVFNDITSNEFGLSAGCGFVYNPVKHLGIGFTIDYTLPIILNYNNSSSTIAFDKHIITTGLSISYLY